MTRYLGFTMDLVLWTLFTCSLAVLWLVPDPAVLIVSLLLAVISAGRMDGWL